MIFFLHCSLALAISYFLSLLIFLICSPCLCSIPHIHPLCILFPVFLSLALHQGAEAQGDTAAERAQVPDTRLHRVSEAQVWLLWPLMLITTQKEAITGRKGGREGGRNVCCLMKSQSQHQAWEADVFPLLCCAFRWMKGNLDRPPFLIWNVN